MWRRTLTWVSGPLLAAFFLWLCFRGVSLAALGEQLRHASLFWLGLSFFSVFVHLILRAWRWRTLLRPVKSPLDYSKLLSATSIGYMASLLPGRVGEVLRPALISRRAEIPFAPALATVGVERAVLDLLAVLVSGAIALVLPGSVSGLGAEADPQLLEQLRAVGAVVLSLGALALVATMVIARMRQPLREWIEARVERLPRIPRAVGRWLASLLPGLAAFSTLGGTFRLVLETAAIWLVIGLGIQAGIIATGVVVPPAAFLIMLPILAVGIGIPTPGGTGTYHFAMKLGLAKLFGVPETAALGAAVVVHAVTWIPVLIMGGAFVALGGLGRSEEQAPLVRSEEGAS